jgi:nicotinamidase-related amidase
VVAQEHWCSSGFANTDPDLQLKRHGLQRLVVIGLIAHTCVEATVRYAAELHAALEVDIPNYAVVATTREVVDGMSG